ncbi:MAG: Amuc_1099 family pilus-like system protein [Chthoniobacterales bacterium]
MKKRSWQYYLLIVASINLTISLLLIIQKTVFNKSLFLERVDNKKPWKTSFKNRVIFLQEKIDRLLQEHSWKREKSDLVLFSSRNYFSKNKALHDLLEEKTSICNPVPNQWLIDNNLDYSNPNILNEDSDGDGFTNLEEWQGSDPYNSPGSQSSDPNNPKSHPLLWTKLKCKKNFLHKNNYYLDFMGVDTFNSEKYFRIQPQTPIPDRNTQRKSILSIKIRHLKLEEKIAELPLAVCYYENKQTVYKETYYDTSELTLKNINTDEYWILVKKSTLHPQPTLVSIIDGISFEYHLQSPPQKIYVRSGSCFELEALPTRVEKENGTKKETEVYQLIKLNSREVTLERKGHYYYIPFSD